MAEVPIRETGGAKRKRPEGSLTSLSSVLSKVVGELGLERRLKEHAFMSMWTEIVDQPFKQVSQPLFIDFEGNLVVSVKNSSVAQELSFQRGTLLRQLTPFALSVGLKIKGIRFDLKNFKEHVPEDSLSGVSSDAKVDPAVPQPEAIKNIDLNEEEHRDLEQFRLDLRASVDRHGDSDLRTCQRIAALYERELRLRAWRRQNGFAACAQCSFQDSRLYGDHRLCRLCHVMKVIGQDR